MKTEKIIIITHDFPGTGGGGVFNFVKYLPRFGYQTVVITNRAKKRGVEDKIIADHLDGDCEIFRTICLNKSPFRVFSKFFHSWATTTYLEKIFFPPDLFITWVPSALLKAFNIIRNDNINCVLTSSPPESVHVTGLLLKKITGVKWIAHFRDLWTTKEVVNRPPTRFHNSFNKYIERTIYRNANHIIANTQGNFDIYRDCFSVPREKMTIITNGYDANEINHIADQIGKKQKREFSVGYMGFFDKPGFPWKEFLLAIKKMIQIDREIGIRVNICGHVSYNARCFISDLGLDNYITLYGVLPHFDAVRKIMENDLFLLLMYETDYSEAIVPHKLYPYLGMQKPILAIAEENGEVANILRITETGKVISAKRDDGIYKTLVEYYQEWKNCGGIRYDPNIKEIEKYEVSKLTEKLSYTIKNLI